MLVFRVFLCQNSNVSRQTKGTIEADVANAVVRSGVLDRLETRWDCTITTVVAGAGFGKSVALGQALRANRARPRGVEGWLSCRSGCESPDRLAALRDVGTF